jgi:hypothetical protein
MPPNSDLGSLGVKHDRSNNYIPSTDIFDPIENNDFPAAECYNWCAADISGVLRNVESFGNGWWYRLQLADEVLTCGNFERSRVYGRPLRSFARSWFPLPDGRYHVVWAPQWVPAASISKDLKIAFWNRMPSAFWSLTDSLEEDMIWREEVERYVCLSRDFSKHLCTQKTCMVCNILPDPPDLRRSSTRGSATTVLQSADSDDKRKRNSKQSHMIRE